MDGSIGSYFEDSLSLHFSSFFISLTLRRLMRKGQKGKSAIAILSGSAVGNPCHHCNIDCITAEMAAQNFPLKQRRLVATISSIGYAGDTPYTYILKKEKKIMLKK